MLTKRTKAFTDSINGREVTGVFAVHGNLDSGGDISQNGSFQKQLENGDRDRVVFLWNHDSWIPPIASIKDIYEIDRAALPPQVKEYAPDATGGAVVVREYLQGVQLADHVFAGLEAGAIKEMSYAYDIVKGEWGERDGMRVHFLEELKLYDVSDVPWGMNPATSAVKRGRPDGSQLDLMEHGGVILDSVESYLNRVLEKKEHREKQGRELSTANWERLEGLHAKLVMVTSDLKALLDSTSAKASEDQILRVMSEIERTKFKLTAIQMEI